MPLLSPNEVAHIVLHSGWKSLAEARIAIAVAGAESGFNTDAVARTNVATSPSLGQRALGLFMISNLWHPEKMAMMGNWRDGYDNAAVARLVFQRAGNWEPWEAFTNGSYQRHLPDADIALKAPVKAIRAPGAKVVVP